MCLTVVRKKKYEELNVLFAYELNMCIKFSHGRKSDRTELIADLHLVTTLRTASLPCPQNTFHGVLLSRDSFAFHLNMDCKAPYCGTYKKLPHEFSLVTAR